jgi:hypothetical protein
MWSFDDLIDSVASNKSSAGMMDSCVVSCCQKLGNVNEANCPKNGEPYKEAKTWLIDGQDEFSQCMTKFCPFSEPTKHNPEVKYDYIFPVLCNEILIYIYIVAIFAWNTTSKNSSGLFVG